MGSGSTAAPEGSAPEGGQHADKPFARIRRALHRFGADEEELVAEALQEQVESAGATAVARCVDRHRVCVAGTLRSVMLRPRGGVPTLEAELYDGSGTVNLIWLGRRRITGIEPGRSLVVHGRLGHCDGARVIYNPVYELRPTGSDGDAS